MYLNNKEKPIKLSAYRRKITLIDKKIINLLRARVEVVSNISSIKQLIKQPIEDRKRWHHLVTIRSKYASEIGVDTTLVIKIFNEIHKNSKLIQFINSKIKK